MLAADIILRQFYNFILQESVDLVGKDASACEVIIHNFTYYKFFEAIFIGKLLKDRKIISQKLTKSCKITKHYTRF